ncbi:MAG: restriction endonuclease subunit S [Firmicutes bacterium]|nr:restriction endonuclease subunit S [Bacillota bacterium]
MELFNYRIKNVAGTTATALVNKTTFENLRFLIPIFKEQQEIAVFLSKLDRKIERKRKVAGVRESEKRFNATDCCMK